MLKVGITGGMGSGKTTVCLALAALGVPVYDSDTRAKALMGADGELAQAIIGMLGKQAYSADGELNRKYIASKIFSDKSLLANFNAIVHPAVGRDFERWAAELEADERVDYVLHESAILFESGLDKLVDYVVTISAPMEERIVRTTSRSELSTQEVRRRMESQMSDAQREKLADYTLRNGEQELLLPQILELHKILTAQGKTGIKR